MAVKPVPDGYQSVVPYLAVENAGEVLEFMKAAFGGVEQMRLPGPDGTVGHAEVRIGDSVVMVGQPNDPEGFVPGMLHLYVEDVDAAYERAVNAGGTSLLEPTDQFYGDRTASVSDAGGNQWYLATHVEDVSPEEMRRRAAEAAGEGNEG